MTTKETAIHPAPLKRALCDALKQRQIPSGLEEDVAWALETYRVTRGATDIACNKERPSSVS